MIEWYKDKNISIFFDKEPRVIVQYALPSDSEIIKNAKEKYPFKSVLPLRVAIFDHKKSKKYEFDIPKNYNFDGATIPKLFYRVIGANTDNHFLIPALIHDYLCSNHNVIENDRALSTNVFNALLKVSEVGGFKRFLMKNSVALFQTTCCGWGKQ